MVSIPEPPYLGSTIIPRKPSSPSFFICSKGNFCFSSRSITPGSNSFLAKSRAANCTDFCSSVSWKFILYVQLKNVVQTYGFCAINSSAICLSYYHILVLIMNNKQSLHERYFYNNGCAIVLL